MFSNSKSELNEEQGGGPIFQPDAHQVEHKGLRQRAQVEHKGLRQRAWIWSVLQKERRTQVVSPQKDCRSDLQQEGQIFSKSELNEGQGGQHNLELDFLSNVMKPNAGKGQQEDPVQHKELLILPSNIPKVNSGSILPNNIPKDSRSSPVCNEGSKAMFSSADSTSTLPSRQENSMEGWDVLDDQGSESSPKSFHPTSAVEMPSGIDAFKDLNQPAKSDAAECSIISQENEQPAKLMKPPPTLLASLIEPKENPNGIQLVLALENARFGETIFVGAIIQAIPSEFLEFYFFTAKDMALCVGVGLPQAKVILHNDLSITIEETTVSERELEGTWRPFLSDNSCHLVMKVEMEAPGMQVNGDDHVQGETLSRLYGVGFDCGSQNVDETYDAAEVSWPLLYDMALFILTTNDLQCNQTNGKSSAQAGSRSFRGNIQGNMGDQLHRKHANVMKHGNLKGGGGDGNEDGFDCRQSVAEGDCPPVVLKVTVYPLPKSDILDTQVKPFGLEGACIAPNLVFEFRRNRECKRISINTQTRLQLASQKDVLCDTNLFGWYHPDIMVSIGCVDRQSRRVAVLKQGSSKILNPRSSYKYTTTKSGISSNADMHTACGQAGLKLHNAWLGGIELQGSSSGSRTQQEATSNGENMEITVECLFGGFFSTDLSNTEFPASASFSLTYPLDKVSIWHNREFLKLTGLLSTIEPHIEGTWIPFNVDDASPYLFKAERSLKLHTKTDGLRDDVLDHKQEYVLPFYVNHAMSHLKSQRSTHIELSDDQLCVPNVLMVGSVY